MKLNKNLVLTLPCLAIVSLIASSADAHDPVFGVGPHVLYKNGFEVHLGTHREESDERETETELAGMASPATGWPVSAPPHRRNGKYR